MLGFRILQTFVGAQIHQKPSVSKDEAMLFALLKLINVTDFITSVIVSFYYSLITPVWENVFVIMDGVEYLQFTASWKFMCGYQIQNAALFKFSVQFILLRLMILFCTIAVVSKWHQLVSQVIPFFSFSVSARALFLKA